ncbi:MAG: NAD(P)/FAD-dependent oxidoreductase, partial [Pseudomonadota bacterium]
YPEKPIYDIPAYPKISASELIDNLEKQAAPFNPTYHLNQTVDKIAKQKDDSFTISTSAGNVINCKAIIIAAGCGSFAPNRPPLENIEQYEGSSVHYMVKKPEDFAGQNIVIAGGGDSAIDWTLALASVAKKISLVHRRGKFRCAPNNLEKLNELAKEGKVDIVVPYQLHSLEGENKQISAVNVASNDNEIKRIAADHLLPFYGLSMNLGPINDWELNIVNKHVAVEASTMGTNHQGIYAIGDIASYTNKLKLILTGFAEAATACYDAYKIVFPDKVLHFEYSTSKGELITNQ